MADQLFSYVLAICMGLGLSAAAGFRIFVPLFLAGLALRFNLGPASDLVRMGTHIGFAPDAISQPWLASTPSLVALGVATAVEMIAYKIPFLDNLLDAMGAPVALGAGALLATQFLVPQDNSSMAVSLLAIIAGAGSAGVVHGATSLIRAVSTKTTAGLANPIVSTLEAIASTVATVMSLFLPIIAALVLLVSLALVLWILKKRSRKIAPSHG